MADAKKAFLFGLDMTLLDTSELEPARRCDEWDYVKDNLERVTRFCDTSTVPHELPRALRERGHAVAIVTSAPRWYAEALLERFEIAHDVLVARADTSRHKPDPAPINRALELLDVHHIRSFHVGSSPKDAEASFHAGVISVGAGWGVGNPRAVSSAAPDIYLHVPAWLLEQDQLHDRGYAAELICEGHEPPLDAGLFLPCDDRPLTYALGRAFAADDPRYASSALGHRLAELRDSDGTAKLFAIAIGCFLHTVQWRPDLLVSVPPRRGQKRDPFAAVLDLLASDHILPESSRMVPNGLECVRTLAGYDHMAAADRRDVIRGAFRTRCGWRGKRVLLVDDVLVSGATTGECARLLARAGASEVRVLALARAQTSAATKACPVCERPMRIRINRSRGTRFWGCTGYPKDCRYAEDL